jgi:hypothetical protein
MNIKTDIEIANDIFLNKELVLGNIGNSVFVRIKIIEVRTDVPGNYGSKNNIGLKAISSDGVEYTSNWTQFDDISMSPYYLWYGGGKDEGLMYDVVKNLYNKD